MKKIFLLLALISISFNSIANDVPRNGHKDPRIKTVSYNIRDVVTITAHYGFSSMIEFASYENIETVSMGDTLAWNMLNVKNKIFLKPVEDNADTNMQVVTNARVYNFALRARKATNHTDKRLTYTLRLGLTTKAVKNAYSPSLLH